MKQTFRLPFDFDQARTSQKLQVRGIPTTLHISFTTNSHYTTLLLSKCTFTLTTILFRDESVWHQVEFGLLFCREQRMVMMMSWVRKLKLAIRTT